MTDHNVTITLSDAVYSQAQRIADDSAQSIESVLSNRLEATLDILAGLPLTEQAELTALQHLSDEALWTIAREQAPTKIKSRQQDLMDRNSDGTISPEEYAELAELVDLANRLMLRKAEAATLLTKRGHLVTPQQMVG